MRFGGLTDFSGLKSLVTSVVPPGLGLQSEPIPSAEALGYIQSSLTGLTHQRRDRGDKDVSRSQKKKQIPRRYAPRDDINLGKRLEASRRHQRQENLKTSDEGLADN